MLGEAGLARGWAGAGSCSASCGHATLARVSDGAGPEAAGGRCGGGTARGADGGAEAEWAELCDGLSCATSGLSCATGELGDESDWKARWAEPSNLRDSQPAPCSCLATSEARRLLRPALGNALVPLRSDRSCRMGRD
eukprot:SAG31_NODE_10153_length_1177_cov_1.456401_1_plen_138_part_00